MRLLCLALCAVIAFALPASAHAADGPRITGFSAYLFDHRTGQLSADLLAEGGPELGNVLPVSVLVVVRLEPGADGSTATTPPMLRLRATESGAMRFADPRPHQADRRILDETRTLRYAPGRDLPVLHAGFWLGDASGCSSITLEATLVGNKDAPAATQTLPFACYE